jgi:hypothetical protein
MKVSSRKEGLKGCTHKSRWLKVVVEKEEKKFGVREVEKKLKLNQYPY